MRKWPNFLLHSNSNTPQNRVRSKFISTEFPHLKTTGAIFEIKIPSALRTIFLREWGASIKIVYRIKYNTYQIQSFSSGRGPSHRPPPPFRPPLPPPSFSPSPSSPSPSPPPSPKPLKICSNTCPKGWSGPGSYKQGCPCTPPPTCKNTCMKGQIGPGPYPGCICTDPPKCKNACPYGYKGPSNYPACTCTPPPPRSPSAQRICKNVCPRGYSGPGPYPNCTCTPTTSLYQYLSERILRPRRLSWLHMHATESLYQHLPLWIFRPGCLPRLCLQGQQSICINSCPSGYSGPGAWPACQCEPLQCHPCARGQVFKPSHGHPPNCEVSMRGLSLWRCLQIGTRHSPLL